MSRTGIEYLSDSCLVDGNKGEEIQNKNDHF